MTSTTRRRGLVLGGGGITGIAWETGLLAGLAAAGVDLTTADRVVGTSAGSIVGAQVTSQAESGIGLAELYRRQLLAPADLGDDAVPLAEIGHRVLAGYVVSLVAARGDSQRFGRALGKKSRRAAVRGKVPSVSERYSQVRQRLTSTAWPNRDLVITAVDTATGTLAAFDRTSGVDLEDAINASCAVPAVYPPIEIAGRTYIDGGLRSGSNADLARGCDVVVAVCPLDRAVGPMRSAAQFLEELGIPHTVITPDAASLKAIGKNVLDPAARPPSAQAGYQQAQAHVEQLRGLWGSGL